MSRGHVLIALAVIIAGIIVAVAMSGESCDSWHKRETRAFADSLYGGPQADAEYYRVRAERPEGC